ncbi:hypothetical protein [Streptomyces sp. JJ36]|uniref:hypothetical protein n=1 Tax=Streptomyces sp. JJ36 TaxID=2736645 RepID=UPI001F38D6FE|nr:hypothetical protein [Streptomyces sp. JJ36]MCF6525026.1 hypothetical protein [Streptomyces sp. JJ36]
MTEYFPEFGALQSVVWKGEVLGEGRSAVPGPSDLRVSGVAVLTAAAAGELRTAYAWQDAPGTPSVLADVRPHVPESPRWQVSDAFTSAVTGERYSGSFSVDFTRKVVVFDTRNPEKPPSSGGA